MLVRALSQQPVACPECWMISSAQGINQVIRYRFHSSRIACQVYCFHPLMHESPLGTASIRVLAPV